jgi:hypothetical protein
MIEHLQRRSETWLVRVLGNAGLLALAVLLVASIGLGRFGLALVWLGALLVLFVQTFEAGRLAVPADDNGHPPLDAERRPYAKRLGVIRLMGAACALLGVIVGL